MCQSTPRPRQGSQRGGPKLLEPGPLLRLEGRQAEPRLPRPLLLVQLLLLFILGNPLECWHVLEGPLFHLLLKAPAGVFFGLQDPRMADLTSFGLEPGGRAELVAPVIVKEGGDPIGAQVREAVRTSPGRGTVNESQTRRRAGRNQSIPTAVDCRVGEE